MANRVIERAYDSIREYVPEDARRILDSQAPKIEKFIDDELDKFGAELTEWISAEVEKVVEEQRVFFEQDREALKQIIEELRHDVATNDETLNEVVVKLEAQLDKYEERAQQLGKNVREKVSVAVKSTGLPFI